jgi:hypothetical protein
MQPRNPSDKKTSVFITRQILLWICLIISTVILFKVASPMLTRIAFWEGDFALYWSTGRLNITGGNPYSPQENLALEKEQKLIAPEVTEIVSMRYPPWTMPIISLLGLFSYPDSRLLWMLLNIAAILFSSGELWSIYQGPPRLRWVAWIIGFCFAPTFFALGRGQLSPLMLVGFVGFLKYIEKPQKYWLAGVFLTLTTFKFHIFPLFFLALAFWLPDHRRWMVLVGFLAAIVVALGVVLPLNPAIIQQYLTARQAFSHTNFATATIGTFLRETFDPQLAWLQFIPVLFGIFWLIIYWRRRRLTWQWNEQLPWILLVSFSTAAFAWTYDQVVLIMIGVIAFINIILKNRSWQGILWFLVYAGINILTVILHRSYDEAWFFWLAPAWLVWFFVTRKWSGKMIHEQSSLENY